MQKLIINISKFTGQHLQTSETVNKHAVQLQKSAAGIQSEIQSSEGLALGCRMGNAKHLVAWLAC